MQGKPLACLARLGHKLQATRVDGQVRFVRIRGLPPERFATAGLGSALVDCVRAGSKGAPTLYSSKVLSIPACMGCRRPLLEHKSGAWPSCFDSVARAGRGLRRLSMLPCMQLLKCRHLYTCRLSGHLPVATPGLHPPVAPQLARQAGRLAAPWQHGAEARQAWVGPLASPRSQQMLLKERSNASVGDC